MNKHWEYTTVDWYWNDSDTPGNIIVFLPNSEQQSSQGDEPEALQVLNNLGGEGWEIITSTSGDRHGRGAWTSWTLKRLVG